VPVPVQVQKQIPYQVCQMVAKTVTVPVYNTHGCGGGYGSYSGGGCCY
jgi:hypothetical protein